MRARRALSSMQTRLHIKYATATAARNCTIMINVESQNTDVRNLRIEILEVLIKSCRREQNKWLAA